MRITYNHHGRLLSVDLRRDSDSTFSIVVDGRPYEVQVVRPDASSLQIVIEGQTRTVHLARIGSARHVAIDGTVYVLTTDAATASERGAATLVTPQVRAPMPGKVLRVLVEEGQQVAAGDGLLILEAMKMENRLTAEAAATVRTVSVREGQMVDAGEVLIELRAE